MKKILILTAGYGEGHNTAARAIRDALQQLASDEAEVQLLDLCDMAYGRANDISRALYVSIINKAPHVWQKIFDVIHQTPAVESMLFTMGRMQRLLEGIVQREQPRVILSTYPVYNYLLNAIYADRERNFRQVTMITDSITINAVWYRAWCDDFIVTNAPTAEVLRQAGVDAGKIRECGFPVAPVFATLQETRSAPDAGNPPRVLYMINSGKHRAVELVRQLISRRGLRLTVTVGRDDYLRRQIEDVVAAAGATIEIHGWTSQMPQLLSSHHLLIGKAGGATVQEAIAARCPMIISQVVPGQEEGNAQLIADNDAGRVALDTPAILQAVDEAFAGCSEVWQRWHRNIAQISRPGAALDVARWVMTL